MVFGISLGIFACNELLFYSFFYFLAESLRINLAMQFQVPIPYPGKVSSRVFSHLVSRVLLAI